MSAEPRLTFNLIETSRRKSKDGADIVIEGHGLKLDDRAAVHLFVDLKRDPFGIGKRQTIHEFGCDVKENTDTRLVVTTSRSRNRRTHSTPDSVDAATKHIGRPKGRAELPLDRGRAEARPSRHDGQLLKLLRETDSRHVLLVLQAFAVLDESTMPNKPQPQH